MIDSFRDKRPISTTDDPRLISILDISVFFNNWKKHADNSTSKDRYKAILSLQCQVHTVVL